MPWPIPPRMRNACLAAAVLVLPACAGYPDSAQRTIPAASSMVLLQPLQVPADDARVFFQDGRQQRRSEVSRYYPACSIGLRRQDGDEHIVDTIEPARFDTGRSRTWRRAEAPPPLRVAGTELSAGLMLRERDNLQRVWQYTEVRLHNEAQPQVYDLRCQVNTLRHTPPLSVEQIRQAMAGVAELHLAGE